MNIDTNINNYSVEEITRLLKLKNTELDHIFVTVLDTLDRVNETSLPTNKKQTILLFFRQCFFKLCKYYNYIPSETMNTNIANRLAQNSSKEQVEKKEQFVGTLPTKVPEAVTVSSNIDKYARGTVNPIQRETVNHLLTINSKFRDSKQSTTTDFSVMLTESMNNVVSLKLASVELMNSYYAISDYLKTNLFTIESYKINTSSKAITDLYKRDIQISEGNYTNDRMVTTLNTLFNADPSLNMIETRYSALKGRIYFAINNLSPPPPAGLEYAFNLYFTISTDPARPLFLNYGWLLGFKKADYIFTKDYSTVATPTKEIGFNPESPLDFTGTKFFLLEVTDYNNNSAAVLKYNTNENYWFNVKDVLAKIPNISPTYSLILEDSSDKIFKTRNYFGPVKLQKLRIRLLDENGKVVDLNGSEMVISFQVESLDVPYKNKI
jgi:hypothetical protein